MYRTSVWTAAALLAVSAVVRAEPVGDMKASTSNFTLDHRVEVPGQILSPGEYTIHVVSILTGRLIVRVDSATSKDHAIFLAVPAFDLMGSSPGPIPWNDSPKGVQALRGFYFPVGYAVEFVYPKAEAAELAKLNTTRIIAVDPDSEGRPKVKNMSPDDLQIVTLWSLSLTRTGPNDKVPALLAKRYQAPQPQVARLEPVSPPSTPAPVPAYASVTPPPPYPILKSNAPTPSPKTTPRSAALKPITPPATIKPIPPPQVASFNTEDAGLPNPSPRRRVPLAVLPHTASTLPLTFLLAFLSLVAATGMRLRSWLPTQPRS